MVASVGRVSSRRSNSKTDSLVSDEEASQTFVCWQKDLAADTSLCSPVVDDSLLANVSDLGWDTEQCLSEMSIADSEKYERKTSEAYWKVFARARFPLPCAALHGVGDVCRMRDLLKTATSQSTPSATKPLRLRNDFEDFFDTERSQLICSAGLHNPPS